MRNNRICDEYKKTGVRQRNGTTHSLSSVRSAGSTCRIKTCGDNEEIISKAEFRTTKKTDELRCVYTVETAGIMVIILFCFTTIIMYSFTKRDELYRQFVMQEAAHNASHIEKTWAGDEYGIDAVKELSTEQLGVIPNLNGYVISVKRNIFGASAEDDSETVEEQIYDPENDMRRNSVVEELFSKNEK